MLGEAQIGPLRRLGVKVEDLCNPGFIYNKLLGFRKLLAYGLTFWKRSWHTNGMHGVIFLVLMWSLHLEIAVFKLQAGKALMLCLPTTEIVSTMLTSLTWLALKSIVTTEKQVSAVYHLLALFPTCKPAQCQRMPLWQTECQDGVSLLKFFL